jgi:hypothetical protein
MMDMAILVEKYLSERFKRESNEKEKFEKLLSNFIQFLKNEGKYNYYKDFSVDKCSLTEAVENDSILFLISYFKSAPQKSNALKRLKSFWRHASEQKHISFDPLESMPDSIAMSEEERLIDLIKLIQTEPKKIEDLSKALIVSERTLRSDIKKLRVGEGMWKHIRIDELSTRKGSVYYSCSIHPFFIAFNLTALTELIVGIIELQKSDFSHAKPFEILYKQIWPQLTEYAKERIARAGIKLPDESAGPDDVSGFIDESEFLRGNIPGMLIYSLKAEIPVTIFFEQDESLIKRDVYVVKEDYQDHKCTFRTNDKKREFKLPLEAIQKVEIQHRE